MKKLIGTAMLAALLATSAFAELSISGGALQLWSPVAYNGGDVVTGIQCPWGGGRTANIGFTWVSEDEKAGAAFTFVYDPWVSGIGPDGNRLIWVKPWDFLKLSLGHWDNVGGTDITSVNTASWDWLRPGTWLVGDSHLYSENEASGALFEITPVENLWIAVGLPFDLTSTDYREVIQYDENGEKKGSFYEETTKDNANDIAYHMFEALAADVAYTVPDVLKVMVGWRGGRYNDGHRDDFATTYKIGSDFANVGEVDVLLSLLAVENLQLDVGARINILDSDKVDDGTPKTLVGLKAGYNITDNFSIKADFATKIKKTLDPEFQFGVGVGVGLTDSLSLVADFRGRIISWAKDADYEKYFSFLVGLNYACSSNASVGIGFQGKTNGGGFGPLEANADNFGFAVPIRVDVHF